MKPYFIILLTLKEVDNAGRTKHWKKNVKEIYDHRGLCVFWDPYPRVLDHELPGPFSRGVIPNVFVEQESVLYWRRFFVVYKGSVADAGVFLLYALP